MAFELAPGLAGKDFVTDLELCNVRFENNRFYPWVFLIPRRENVKNMTFLSMDDRLQLMREIALVEKAMASVFPHDQTNVAMIGNRTPQLHVHVLCRRKGDPDWPGTVWDGRSEPYPEEEKLAAIEKIRAAVESMKSNPEYGQRSSECPG
jgi:diadenosine tetraphosphate (Ap4A) HIT family hydrolase